MILDPPEERRFYDYRWPYPWTDLFYTCWPVYNQVKKIDLYYNGLPPGSKTACWIGRIEALEELPPATIACDSRAPWVRRPPRGPS